MAWIKFFSLTFLAILFVMFLFLESSYNLDFSRLGVVNNFVTEIYLRNRLYDTLFEVLVFSLSAMGIFLFNYSEERQRFYLHETHIRILLKFLSYFVILLSFYLAYYGDKTPGGGFSAGVVGGTGVLLYSLSTTFSEIEYAFEKYKVKLFEKIAIFIIYGFSISSFLGNVHVRLLSILIYLKVMFGMWIIIYSFIKHRGII